MVVKRGHGQQNSMTLHVLAGFTGAFTTFCWNIHVLYIASYIFWILSFIFINAQEL